MMWETEEHCIIIKESILQEHITVLDLYISDVNSEWEWERQSVCVCVHTYNYFEMYISKSNRTERRNKHP